jgi:hypothetical protein
MPYVGAGPARPTSRMRRMRKKPNPAQLSFEWVSRVFASPGHAMVQHRWPCPPRRQGTTARSGCLCLPLPRHPPRSAWPAVQQPHSARPAARHPPKSVCNSVQRPGSARPAAPRSRRRKRQRALGAPPCNLGTPPSALCRSGPWAQQLERFRLKSRNCHVRRP